MLFANLPVEEAAERFGLTQQQITLIYRAAGIGLQPDREAALKRFLVGYAKIPGARTVLIRPGFLRAPEP